MRMEIMDIDLQRANKLLARLVPDAKPFRLDTTLADKWGEGYQEMVSDSLDLQMYCGDILADGKHHNRGYLVQGIVMIHNTHMRMDGSGEPDDVDIVDLKDFTHFNDALISLFEEYFRQHIADSLQCIMENEMFENKED